MNEDERDEDERLERLEDASIDNFIREHFLPTYRQFVPTGSNNVKAKYRPLHLRPEVSNKRCSQCRTTDRRRHYYELPCGHVLDQSCIELLMLPRRRFYTRSCPKCHEPWGLPLPLPLLQRDFTGGVPEFALDPPGLIEWSTEIWSGFNYFVRNYGSATKRLMLKARLDLPPDMVVVLSYDTCVWSLLSIGRAMLTEYSFTWTERKVWNIIIIATCRLLRNLWGATQGSVTELKQMLHTGIVHALCHRPRGTYALEYTTQISNVQHMMSAEHLVLWQFLDTTNHDYGKHLGFLIDGLILGATKFETIPVFKIMQIRGVDSASCSICTFATEDDDKLEMLSLPCGHCFCRGCLSRWFKEKPTRICMTCRQDFGKYYPLELFDWDYKKLYTLVRDDEQRLKLAFDDVKDFLSTTGIREKRNLLLAGLAGKKYTISADNCIFALYTVAEALVKFCKMSKPESKQFRIIYAVIGRLFRDGWYGRHVTGVEFAEELELETCKMLQNVRDFENQVRGNTQGNLELPDYVPMGKLALLWDDSSEVDEWDFFNHHTTLGVALDIAVLYTISKCPEHQERPQFGGDGK